MLNSTQMRRVLEALDTVDLASGAVQTAEVMGDGEEQSGDTIRRDVLLELRGIPPVMANHLAMVWADRFKNVVQVRAADLEADAASLLGATLPPGSVAAFQKKAIQRLTENCESLSIVEWLGSAPHEQRGLEVGPIFTNWPREILEERRWNAIESAVPGLPDLPLTSTWVHLRLRRMQGRTFGLRHRAREPSSALVLEPSMLPAYLDAEFEANLIGDPVEDVLYRIKGLVGVLGHPGAGKSTLLKWLAQFLIMEAECPFVVPIFVPLREYALARRQGGSLDLFTYFLRQRGVTRADQWDRWQALRYQLESRGRFSSAREMFFWLLDGWDEVPPELREDLLQELRRIEGQPGVITSRHSAFPFSLPCIEFFEIAPLSRHAQEQLASSWLTEMNRSGAVAEFLRRIRASATFRKLSRNPMLLTLLCGLLTDPCRSAGTRIPDTRHDVFRETLRRIAAHHTQRHPGQPFDEGCMRQTARLAYWLLLEAPNNPSYVFTADEVAKATGDAGLFASVLEPSRMVCSPFPEGGTFQFLHATFQEYLTAEWLRVNPAIFRKRLGARILLEGAWSEVARFAAAASRRGEFFRDLWRAVRQALAEPDQYGVLLARTAGLLAEAQSEDGGKFLLGFDVRLRLWRLIIRHRAVRPFLLTDALLALDTKAFIDFARHLLHKHDPEDRTRVLPFLRHLPEEIASACLDEDVTIQDRQENGPPSAEEMLNQALRRHDFVRFKATFAALPADELGWDLREQALKAAPEFGSQAVGFLTEILTSSHVDELTRGSAAYALADCESPDAPRALIKVLASSPMDHPAVISILGAVQGHLLSPVESNLVAHFVTDSDDPDVRETAAGALCTSRSPGIAAHLLRACRKERIVAVRTSVYSALIEIADPVVLPELWAMVDVLLGSTNVDRLEGAAAILSVVATAAREPDRHLSASILREVTDRAAQWLAQPGNPFASTAITAATMLGDELNMHLVRVLRERRHSPKVLIDTCQAVGTLRLTEAIPVLRQVLSEHPDLECDEASQSLHQAAAEALGKIAPANLLGIKARAADRARAQLAFDAQVLFYPHRVANSLETQSRRDPIQPLVTMEQDCDLAVCLALQEEFSVFDRVFGGYASYSKDPELALTYFFYEVEAVDSGAPCHLVVCWSGEMGALRANECTMAMIRRFRPKNLVIVGIAGSTGDALRIGDVFLPKEVVDYQAISAIVDLRKTWTYRLSGNAFRSSQELLNDFRNLQYTQRAAFEAWKADAAATLHRSLATDLLERLLQKGILRREPALLVDDSKLASGPSVGRSIYFLNWLRERDRKFAALEMESAGIYSAADLTRKEIQPKLLAVRGISDFADRRKSILEKASKGHLRSVAMSNAAALLRLGINCRVFASN
jgi:nucleoside phosphorylase/energy-coupling factor transporter ATP-binding protein EcfA2